jgi:hypothetical protein
MSFSALRMTFLRFKAVGTRSRLLGLGCGAFLALLALLGPTMIGSNGHSADAAGTGGMGRGLAATGGGARSVTITDELGTEQKAERVEIWTDGRMVAALEVNRRKRRDAVTLVLDNTAQGYLVRGYSQYTADGRLVQVALEGAGTIDPRISLAYEPSLTGLDREGGRAAATLRPR